MGVIRYLCTVWPNLNGFVAKFSSKISPNVKLPSRIIWKRWQFKCKLLWLLLGQLLQNWATVYSHIWSHCLCRYTVLFFMKTQIKVVKQLETFKMFRKVSKVRAQAVWPYCEFFLIFCQATTIKNCPKLPITTISNLEQLLKNHSSRNDHRLIFFKCGKIANLVTLAPSFNDCLCTKVERPAGLIPFTKIEFPKFNKF